MSIAQENRIQALEISLQQTQQKVSDLMQAVTALTDLFESERKSREQAAVERTGKQDGIREERKGQRGKTRA